MSSLRRVAARRPVGLVPIGLVRVALVPVVLAPVKLVSVVLVPVVLVAVVLAGCGGAAGGPSPGPAAGSVPVTGTPGGQYPPCGPGSSGGLGGPSGPRSSGGPGGFSPTDTAWLQLTIAMDERILTVLDTVPDRPADSRVTALAAEVAADHRRALSRLRALHDRSGGPTVNPHEGHDMPGMATRSQLDALRRADGRDAVDRFAGMLGAHLDQSVRLARAEREHGSEQAVRAIATEIARTRTDQRRHLDRLLPNPPT